jgi:hypothetical protein
MIRNLDITPAWSDGQTLLMAEAPKRFTERRCTATSPGRLPQ